MSLVLHRALPFVVFGLFACACFWYTGRTHRSWKRDGVVRIFSSRGPTMELRSRAAVYGWLGWALVVGAVAAIVALISLVFGLP